MLHIVEPNVQDIFLNFPNMGDVKHYQRAVDALRNTLLPKSTLRMLDTNNPTVCNQT